MAAHLRSAASVLSPDEQEKTVVPAVLLPIDAEIAYRHSQVRADWEVSRPAPRVAERARTPALRVLRRRAARRLHA